ncbi:hypothetical protein E2542_SST31569 [Spatholobus suberectus]|nr:hypothetical protein E2542_SST31569 [Spatholobus suberectus]
MSFSFSSLFKIAVSFCSFTLFSYVCFTLLLSEDRKSVRGSIDQNVATSTFAFSSSDLMLLSCMGVECLGDCKIKDTKRVLPMICQLGDLHFVCSLHTDDLMGLFIYLIFFFVTRYIKKSFGLFI